MFRRLEKDAVERASGCGPAELAYLRDDIERLKGTAVELCAEAAFMEGTATDLLPASPESSAEVVSSSSYLNFSLHTACPTSSSEGEPCPAREHLRRRLEEGARSLSFWTVGLASVSPPLCFSHQQLFTLRLSQNDGKKHREQVEALKQEIEQTIQKLVRSLQEFDAGVSASRAQLRGVEEAHAFVAEQTAAGPSSLEAVLRESAAERAALAAAEAADRELRAQLAARLRENAAAAHELAPAEARIAEMLEEARARRAAQPHSTPACSRDVLTCAQLAQGCSDGALTAAPCCDGWPPAKALEAKQAGERKAHDTQKRVEEAALYSSELCALLRCVFRQSLRGGAVTCSYRSNRAACTAASAR